jgi:hypothetical protein
MKRFFIVGLIAVCAGGIFTNAATACPVATGVALAPSVATLVAPVAVSSSCVCGQQAAQQASVAAPAAAVSVVQAVPVISTLALPSLSVVTTPVVVEQIVKVKQRRVFRARVH